MYIFFIDNAFMTLPADALSALVPLKSITLTMAWYMKYGAGRSDLI